MPLHHSQVLAGTTTGAIGFGWIAQFVGYRAGFVAFGLALAAGSAVFWRKR